MIDEMHDGQSPRDKVEEKRLPQARISYLLVLPTKAWRRCINRFCGSAIDCCLHLDCVAVYALAIQPLCIMKS